MKILLILILMLCLNGCCTESEKQREDYNRMAIQACVDKGGVPILNEWGRLLDCKFPPPKEK